MSIIEFEIKNPRKKLEFYEQLHKENITRIEKLRKENKQLKEVIDELKDRITIKLVRYINEKDYLIDDVALDELLHILDKVGVSDE